MPLFLIFDTLEIIEEIMNEKICPKNCEIRNLLVLFPVEKIFLIGKNVVI